MYLFFKKYFLLFGLFDIFNDQGKEFFFGDYLVILLNLYLKILLFLLNLFSLIKL